MRAATSTWRCPSTRSWAVCISRRWWSGPAGRPPRPASAGQPATGRCGHPDRRAGVAGIHARRTGSRGSIDTVMPQQVPSVTVADLPEGVTLLDVREDDEWAAGHAPTAVHIPLGDLAGRLDEVPSDGIVHVVCRGGGRSARATAYLNANGWDAVNVDCGMKSWHAEGR